MLCRCVNSTKTTHDECRSERSKAAHDEPRTERCERRGEKRATQYQTRKTRTASETLRKIALTDARLVRSGPIASSSNFAIVCTSNDPSTTACVRHTFSVRQRSTPAWRNSNATKDDRRRQGQLIPLAGSLSRRRRPPPPPSLRGAAAATGAAAGVVSERWRWHARTRMLSESWERWRRKGERWRQKRLGKMASKAVSGKMVLENPVEKKHGRQRSDTKVGFRVPRENPFRKNPVQVYGAE